MRQRRVEILAAYRPFAAATACAALDGELAAKCRVALGEGRYGLGKPFHLYFRERLYFGGWAA